MSTTTITRELAARWRLAENMLFVRSAIYLGMGPLSIEEHIDNVMLSRVQSIIIETARKLGMNDSDTVEVLNDNSDYSGR